MYFYVFTNNMLNLICYLCFYWLLLVDFIDYFYLSKYAWLFWDFSFCNTSTSTSLLFFKILSFLNYIWFIVFCLLLIDHFLRFLFDSCYIAAILFHKIYRLLLLAKSLIQFLTFFFFYLWLIIFFNFCKFIKLG